MLTSRHRRMVAVTVILLALSSCRPFWVKTPAVPEGCMTGVLTAEGDICQGLRADRDDKLYTFFADMNGYSLGERVCLCGAKALMTRCVMGIPIDVEHFDRECPGPPPAY